jgi:hypothetical protein
LLEDLGVVAAAAVVGAARGQADREAEEGS